MTGATIPPEDLNWTLMVCICLVSKLVNDNVYSNRIFAYLLNLDITEFNKLEQKVLRTLNFNVSVEEEMYNVYNEEIRKFSQTQSEALRCNLAEFRENKKKIREFKKLKHAHHSSETAAILARREKYDGDFTDIHMQKAIEEQGSFNAKAVRLHCVSKFRFESYNSFTFGKSGTPPMRSKTQPRLDE
eukprot:CAMPEP_0168329646 /NCGR_PEP_ID=MMETSP0213-20121227/7233_1 /TAXON_ID=151035 /ORGANISM="Euplotes harpa, Strain FSP1.4" /LENGTH=186 /DNA_ID=CAMNT_0008333013 /DNA_START=238 /DNA_END=798 /DNA_ORIENTATION=+